MSFMFDPIYSQICNRVSAIKRLFPRFIARFRFYLFSERTERRPVPHGGSAIGSSRQSHQRIGKLAEQNQKANWQRKCTPSRRYNVQRKKATTHFNRGVASAGISSWLLTPNRVWLLFILRTRLSVSSRAAIHFYVVHIYDDKILFTSSFHFSRAGMCVPMPHEAVHHSAKIQYRFVYCSGNNDSCYC